MTQSATWSLSTVPLLKFAGLIPGLHWQTGPVSSTLTAVAGQYPILAVHRNQDEQKPGKTERAGKDDPTPPKRYNCCHDSDEQRSLPVRCNNRVDSVSLTSKFQITEDPISSYLSCFHDSGNSLGV
ncbi:hypothetical protein OPV22_005628 [Ensete ventricosum]|uniref:Uncharacterized protein n=1 Tax=Ensete ventricosum TaxID=4639 RepID=A0AAV8Q9M3_ENSVE|nr:hypothetical protein OPV22_005628 [Ensete ventricosum]